MSSLSRCCLVLALALCVTVAAILPASSAGAAEWGEISGTVTDETTGLPIEGMYVAAYPWTANFLSEPTNSAGQYVIRFLEPGTYIVMFAAEWGAMEQPGYLPEWWDDKKDQSSADLVTVTAGTRTVGIDAALTPAGSISGRVTDERTGTGIPNVQVTAQSCEAFCSGAYSYTDGDGVYQLTGPGMAAGQYKVSFHEHDYESEWWDDQVDFASGDWVTVVNGEDTPGIDAALTPTAPLPYAPDVIRLAGDDRYGTAVAISEYAFPTGDGFPSSVPVAYIATGADYPDALSATPAAALRHGPVLLVGRNSVPPVTAAELKRLSPQEIVIVGGTGVVSHMVESTLRGLASKVTRLAGIDRFATAAAVSAASFPSGADRVFIATGFGFPDALAGGALAGDLDGPVLLVGDGIPGATAAELARLDPDEIVVLGGLGVVSAAVADLLSTYAPAVTRIAGPDRYGTAAAISRAMCPDGSIPLGADWVYVATGEDFPDALAIGPVAGGGAPQGPSSGPLLLVRRDSIPWPTQVELMRLAPKAIVIAGGTGVISAQVEDQLESGWFHP